MKGFFKRLIHSSTKYLFFWGVIFLCLVFFREIDISSITSKIAPKESVYYDINAHKLNLSLEKKDNPMSSSEITNKQEDIQEHVYMYMDGKYVAIPIKNFNKE